MPNPNNINRANQSVSPYVVSSNSTLTKNYTDNIVNGESLTYLGMSPSLLTSQDYSEMNQANLQEGTFISKTDKKTYAVAMTSSEKNPVKECETNTCPAYGTTSDISAKDKDKRVQKDNTPTNLNAMFTNYGGLGQYGNGDMLNTNPSSNTPDDTTNFTLDYKYYKTEKVLGLEKDLEDSSFPYMVISESRTGTSAEGADISGIDITGSSVRNAEIVSIKVLQNVDNFSFSMQQNFQNISPRGSQTPLRFYQDNPGRMLSFTAKFHQQEYPLEPLLSIAEKAQYLARPYKHTDYSLIPKLVKINIPGRIFRGYLQNVGITYSGDDYSAWSKYPPTKASADLLGKNYSFYGGYIAQDLDNITSSNTRSDVNTGQVNYGLGSMTIDFQLIIVEEITLTNLTTLAEKEYQKAYNEAKAKAQYEEAAKEAKLDDVRILVEAFIDKRDPDTIDDHIFVDSNGDVVGYYIYNVDEGVNSYFYADGSYGGSSPADGGIYVEFYGENTLLYPDYLQKKEISNGDPNVKAESSYLVPSDNISNLLEEKTTDDIIAYIMSRYSLRHPTPQETEAYLAYLRSLNRADLYDLYKWEVEQQTGSSELVYFLNGCTGYYTNSDSYITTVPDKVAGFLESSITNIESCQEFLKNYGYIALKGACIRYNQGDYETIVSIRINSLLTYICGYEIDWNSSSSSAYGFLCFLPSSTYDYTYCGFDINAMPISQKSKNALIRANNNSNQLYFKNIPDLDFSNLSDDSGVIMDISKYICEGISYLKSCFYSGFQKWISDIFITPYISGYPYILTCTRKLCEAELKSYQSSHTGEIIYGIYWDKN